MDLKLGNNRQFEYKLSASEHNKMCFVVWSFLVRGK